jgi:hypothetical protein
MKRAAVFALVVLGIQARTINTRLEALVAPYPEANAPGIATAQVM